MAPVSTLGTPTPQQRRPGCGTRSSRSRTRTSRTPSARLPAATGRSHRRPGPGNRDTTRPGPPGRRPAGNIHRSQPHVPCGGNARRIPAHAPVDRVHNRDHPRVVPRVGNDQVATEGEVDFGSHHSPVWPCLGGRAIRIARNRPGWFREPLRAEDSTIHRAGTCRFGKDEFVRGVNSQLAAASPAADWPGVTGEGERSWDRSSSMSACRSTGLSRGRMTARASP
jgi:hypothetical protein